MDQAKKEYIAKLKRELDNVEDKFQVIIDQTAMIGEDYFSRARENHFSNIILVAKYKDVCSRLESTEASLS